MPSREALRKAIERSANATDWLLVGSAYQVLGEGNAALSAYRRATRLNPRSVDAYRALGAMLLAGGDPQSAALSLRVALALSPDESRSQVLLADALSQLGRHDEAHRLVSSAVRNAPGSPPHMMALARILGRADRRQDAENALDDVLQVSPGDLDATLALARLLIERQDHARACIELRRIERGQIRSIEGALKLGLAFMECSAIDDALEIFQATVERHPESGEAHIEWGRALEAAQRFDEALGAFDSAVRLIPQSVAAHYHLGRLLERSARTNAQRASHGHTHNRESDHDDRSEHDTRSGYEPQSGYDTRSRHDVRKPRNDDNESDDDDDALGAAFDAVRSDHDDIDKTQRTGAALQGDLAVLILSDTLEFLTDQRATGRLRLKSERGEGHVDVVSGLCARVIGPKSRPLGAILEETDVVNFGEGGSLSLHAGAISGDHELARALLAHAIVEATRLREALSTQALAGLTEMLGWNRGEVAFHATAEDHVQHVPELLFDLRPILRAARRHQIGRPRKA